MLCSKVIGQAPNINTVKVTEHHNISGSQNHAEGLDLVIDPFENTIATGIFKGVVDFDFGPAVVTNFAGILRAGYVVKEDSLGNFMWAKIFKNTLGNPADLLMHDIETDADGNIYISGSYKGFIDFDPGSGVLQLNTNTFNIDWIGCIIKLDPQGNFVWAHDLGTTSINHCWDIEVVNKNAIYIVGHYMGAIDFDFGPQINSISAGNTGDAYVLKIDSNANFKWVRTIQSFDNGAYGLAITSDQNHNLIHVGTCNGMVDFDSGPSVLNIGGSNSKCYIQKLDSLGNMLWTKVVEGFIGIPNNRISVITDADDNNIYVTGRFYGNNTDFNPGAGTFNMSTTPFSNRDVFVLKLSPFGDFIWAKSFGGSYRDYVNDIEIDSKGNMYISGSVEGPAEMDPGPNQVYTPFNGLLDGYVLSLDSLGLFRWFHHVGGIGHDDVRDVEIRSNDELVMTGWFSDSVNFDPNTLNQMYIASVDPEAFLISASDCWPNIDLGTTTNSVYTTTYAYSYQWMDCSNSSLVVGDTNAVFYPSSNGTYAVILSNSFCTDTSDCIDLLTLNTDNSIPSNLGIYPNPTNGVFMINIGSYDVATVTIYDGTARIISQLTLSGNTTHYIDLNEAPGVYFIVISAEGNKTYHKLIKQPN